MTKFIAIDSEGVTLDGDTHITTVVMASTCDYISDRKGLSSSRILDWLISLGQSHKGAAFVIFGASYDFNMFLRTSEEDTVRALNANIKAEDFDKWNIIKSEGEAFEVKLMPKKFMVIRREGDKSRGITIYDCIGFFQSSFITAVENWLPHQVGTDDYKLMKEGKAKRQDFAGWKDEDVRRYTAIELRYLVEMMEILNKSLLEVGLKVHRWHGTGAIAEEGLKVHAASIKTCGKLPSQVTKLALQAYFGGRIELFKYGEAGRTPIYEYDLNSAYPAAIADIVETDNALFEATVHDTRLTQALLDTMPEFGLMTISWSMVGTCPIAPFPYRSSVQKKVFFPKKGMGTYHFCEVRAAFAHANRLGLTINCIESIKLRPTNEVKCFDFIKDYYERRRQLVMASKESGVPNGVEKVIKLFLNSIYGKICQTAGGKKRRPKWHNIFWAGYITAKTRATMFEAAMLDPYKVVMIATDGIYTTTPLELPVMSDKPLGGWGFAKHSGGVFVQSGYYYLFDGRKAVVKTRGFDKPKTTGEMEAQLEGIRVGYRTGADGVRIPCTRFTSIATACIGDNYAKWCKWVTKSNDGKEGRLLTLSPLGTKRVPVGGNPATRLCATQPLENLTPLEPSEPYQRGWGDFEDESVIMDELLEDGYGS